MVQKLYIYSRIQANGVRVVVDNLALACLRAGLDVCKVGSLDGIPQEELVLAYGVKETYELFVKGYRADFALLVDAVSLGFWNKIVFYLKNWHIFNYDFFYSVYAWVKWRKRDKAVINHFKNVMLVSQTDIDYLMRLSPKAGCAYHLIQNGANMPDSITEHIASGHLRLGILASWGNPVTYEESAWFVEKYFPRYLKTHPEVQLYLAGRGAYLSKLQGRKNVVVMGEVPDLNDFFSQIDVFLAVNPKGCGVLNRVLDAFAHRVPIVSLPASMSGFQNIDDCYIPFTDYASFVKAMDMAQDASVIAEMVENGTKYISYNNSWEKNYNQLVEVILSL